MGGMVMGFIVTTRSDNGRMVILNTDDISNILELPDGAVIQMKTRSAVLGRYDIVVSDTIFEIMQQLHDTSL